MEDFKTWLQAEASANCIEFDMQDTVKPAGKKISVPAFLWRKKYHCGRQGTGGVGTAYEKKFPDRKRKVESKRVSNNVSSVLLDAFLRVVDTPV